MGLETPDEARLMQPSVLAFIGDAVFNLFIRERLIMNKKGLPISCIFYLPTMLRRLPSQEFQRP